MQSMDTKTIKSTQADGVQHHAVLSSDPFLSFFDVPFLMAPGAVFLGTVSR